MPLKSVETIPILRIFSVEKAIEFYIGFLGFREDWRHQFEGLSPVYMQVSRSGCVFHLSEHHGDCCPGSTVFASVTGLEDYYAEISARKYENLRPCLERTFHQSIQMEVIDPFGNRIRFDESIEHVEPVEQ